MGRRMSKYLPWYENGDSCGIHVDCVQKELNFFKNGKFYPNFAAFFLCVIFQHFLIDWVCICVCMCMCIVT